MRSALLALLISALVLPAHAGTADDTAVTADALVRAIKRHDARSIAARLAAPLQLGGLWFPDAACTKRFGAAMVLPAKDRDALARCLAQLVPQMSTRSAAVPEAAVLTFDPGFEVEVTVADGTVRWIAAAGAGDDRGRPMLTAQAFEALRTRGTTLLDDAVRAELEPELVNANPTSAWIRTCLDADGAATHAIAWSATPRAGSVFLRAIGDWAFRPFTRGHVAVPACALTLLTYPASRAPGTEQLPRLASAAPRVYRFEDDLDPYSLNPIAPAAPPSIATLTPAQLAALAVRPLDPPPATPAQLANLGRWRVTQVNVCIDGAGAVRNIVTIQRAAPNDARLAKIRRWAFRPYYDPTTNTPTDACALLAFIEPP